MIRLGADTGGMLLFYRASQAENRACARYWKPQLCAVTPTVAHRLPSRWQPFTQTPEKTWPSAPTHLPYPLATSFDQSPS